MTDSDKGSYLQNASRREDSKVQVDLPGTNVPLLFGWLQERIRQELEEVRSVRSYRDDYESVSGFRSCW
jgi:hypothetical protein